MRTYIILVILIMFCFSNSLLSQEVRNGIQVNKEFKKMELTAEYELRKYFDRKLDLSHQVEAQMNYNLSDHWSAAASYRYTAKFKTVVSETSENITIDRSRFTAGVSHKTKRF
ncbi:MAG: hypothetical protein MI922_28465, partial [Bacteroidales bacterium]|nr:hypothetical protein [Bacteroidales bacterium]